VHTQPLLQALNSGQTGRPSIVSVGADELSCRSVRRQVQLFQHGTERRQNSGGAGAASQAGGQPEQPAAHGQHCRHAVLSNGFNGLRNYLASENRFGHYGQAANLIPVPGLDTALLKLVQATTRMLKISITNLYF
jgi:hypothetical protein